jgi:uridine kinase
MSENQLITLIGLAGASGAGKSLLTKRIHDGLRSKYGEQSVSVVNEDCYYRRRDQLTVQERTTINYDHPDAFEFDLLKKHLDELKAGDAVDIPQYDYVEHNRSTQVTRQVATRLVLVEGILIFHRPEIRESLDLKVFVDVPLDVCLARRIRRDTQERGRTIDSVLSQYEATVRPMYFEFIEPTKQFADLIVPGGGENEVAADVLLDHLSALIAGTKNPA